MCSTGGTSFYLLVLIIFFSKLSMNAGEDYPRFQNTDVNSHDEGKSKLTEIQSYGNDPHYGQCWTDALARLHHGCKKLTENEQSRMALSFANCHLEKAKFTTYSCREDQNLGECLHHMKGDVSAFQAYTQFFTHTQNICFFLQNQVWHERTEHTVSRLAINSEQVADQLDVSRERQEKMMEKQNISLQQQVEILKNSGEIRSTLQASAKDLESVFEEIKQNTKEQNAQLDATFVRLSHFQRIILGEFTWFNSFLFYAMALLITYLLTSTPRTSSARLPMFGVLALNWCVERMVFTATDSHNQELIYERVWTCRNVFSILAILILFICAYRFKDLPQINNKLLQDLTKQASEIRHQLEHQALPSNIISALKASSHSMLAVGAPVSTQLTNYQPLGRARDVADSAPAGLGEYSSDEMDNDCTYRAELTYQPDYSDTDSASSDSYTTAAPGSRRTSKQPSRRVTPSLEDYRNASGSSAVLLERSGLLNSSILNASTSSAPLTRGSSGGSSNSKRKPGRPKGSTNRSFKESTKTSFTSPYNLRKRPAANYATYSTLHAEDVETFIKQINSFQQSRNYSIHRVETVTASPTSSQSQGRTGRRSTPTRAPGFFSSDDEM